MLERDTSPYYGRVQKCDLSPLDTCSWIILLNWFHINSYTINSIWYFCIKQYLLESTNIMKISNFPCSVYTSSPRTCFRFRIHVQESQMFETKIWHFAHVSHTHTQGYALDRSKSGGWRTRVETTIHNTKIQVSRLEETYLHHFTNKTQPSWPNKRPC